MNFYICFMFISAYLHAVSPVVGISRSYVCVQQHGVGFDSYRPWQSDTDLAGREVILPAS